MKHWWLVVSFGVFLIHAGDVDLMTALQRLKNAYPEHIVDVTLECIVWADGTCMALGESDASKTQAEKLQHPTLLDQLEQPVYYVGFTQGQPTDDPGRIRYEPFFRKMYGDSPAQVKKNLQKVSWMPRIFGEGAYTLLVTRINGVAQKMEALSQDLEELVVARPEYAVFLKNPGGTYCWRKVANTNRLSAHSFGMTIDINTEYSHYWQWDLLLDQREVDEDTQLEYRNLIPWEIVEIFEKYGFIWGGKWHHYDTMHFEYRPELMV